jgi:hypothetical protein
MGALRTVWARAVGVGLRSPERDYVAVRACLSRCLAEIFPDEFDQATTLAIVNKTLEAVMAPLLAKQASPAEVNHAAVLGELYDQARACRSDHGATVVIVDPYAFGLSPDTKRDDDEIALHLFRADAAAVRAVISQLITERRAINLVIVTQYINSFQRSGGRRYPRVRELRATLDDHPRIRHYQGHLDDLISEVISDFHKRLSRLAS